MRQNYNHNHSGVPNIAQYAMLAEYHRANVKNFLLDSEKWLDVFRRSYSEGVITPEFVQVSKNLMKLLEAGFEDTVQDKQFFDYEDTVTMWGTGARLIQISYAQVCYQVVTDLMSASYVAGYQ